MFWGPFWEFASGFKILISTPAINHPFNKILLAFADFSRWMLIIRKLDKGSFSPVACRGLMMPGTTAWLDAPLPNSSIEQWRLVVIVTGYTLFVTSQYDVIFTFANQLFGEVCWHNMNIQGRQSNGRAGGAVRVKWKLIKNKKIVTNYVCFCSSTTLTSKIITEIIENHSKFFGCPNSCNKFV